MVFARQVSFNSQQLSMLSIKICGIRRVEDGLAASEAGADAIGLNFYPKSPRCVTIEEAQAVAQSLPAGVLRVGVFVNEHAEKIIQIASQVPLGAVQLHGDEPPEFLNKLPTDLPVIRAARIDQRGLAPVADYIEQCKTAGRLPDALLLDAASTKGYGGTGEKIDWQLLERERHLIGGLPLILAGGLTPSNLEEAILVAKPDGVDTASGVESSPGVKDPQRVDHFAKTALSALKPS